MASAIQVRPFLPRHLKRVLEVENEAFGRHAYPRELFEELFRECRSLFFVAKRGGRIVGYSVACRGDEQAELVSVAVDKAHRNQGVATALLRATVARLRKAGVGKLALMVRPNNTEAIRFYRGQGFHAAGRIRRYYEDRTDGILMRLRL